MKAQACKRPPIRYVMSHYDDRRLINLFKDGNVFPILQDTLFTDQEQALQEGKHNLDDKRSEKAEDDFVN